MKREPQVNEVNEFLETASDFESPLEVIRESLSNSYDAEATAVDIQITSQPNGSDIVIEDDGHGMDQQGLATFFDLGNSPKSDSIGYKGHGTKIFYKSDLIRVTTVADGTELEATMERPWEKLNQRILPTYEVTERDEPRRAAGTRIEIKGFKSGQGFDPQSLTYDRIHNYLSWQTIAGSTAHYFDAEDRQMAITVELDEAIDDTRAKLETTTRLEFPDEQLAPGDDRFPAERMCKHYPPQELTVAYEGGTTTVQVVGMIGGKAARNELPTFGKHSTQFGVWLAKDFIKIERVNETIAHDNEFLHFFFIANCQDIELSANRGKVRNKSSAVYQALVEELEHYMSKVASDPWFADYLEQRRLAKLSRKAESHQSSVKTRQEQLAEQDSFEPTNPAEVVLGLERTNGADGDDLQVADFEADSVINAIIRQNGELSTAVVHPSLTTHFEEERQLKGVDMLICWDLGDRDQLQEIERDSYRGGALIFDFDADEVIYKNETTTTIDIVRVSDRYPT